MSLLRPLVRSLVIATLALSPLAAQVRVTLANGAAAPMDGRLLVMLSTDSTAEPRFQIADGPKTQLLFGSDVTGWTRGTARTVDANANGYPLASLRAVPPGRYWMQAVLNVYQTYRRADGHVVSLRRTEGKGSSGTASPGTATARRAG